MMQLLTAPSDSRADCSQPTTAAEVNVDARQ